MSCVLLLAAAGCDAQATTDYRGAALLTIAGTVEIPEPHPAGPLVPALGFPGSGSEFYVMDVDVEGTFPADFRIDVYETPPAAALRAGGDGGPVGAVAFITAVPPDHPDVIRYAERTLMTGIAPCIGDGCETPCEATGHCERKSEWCTSDGDCYREIVTCPRLDSPAGQCSMTREGDPKLKEPMWQSFAGFSQNYLVVFLAEAVSADSRVAFLLGSSSALRAGYHLVAVRPLSEEERRNVHECERRAEDLVVARLNERGGTHYLYDEIFQRMCWDDLCDQGFTCPVPDPDSDSELCSLTQDEQDALDAAIEADVELAKGELKCPAGRWSQTVVPDAAHERISVRLSADANPYPRALPLPQ